jgi:hypothetical protein
MFYILSSMLYCYDLTIFMENLHDGVLPHLFFLCNPFDFFFHLQVGRLGKFGHLGFGYESDHLLGLI